MPSKTRAVGIALVNNKGGVGKTTTAVNLAAGLAFEGHKTLLVDLDAQGSASLSVGLPRAEMNPSAADVLLDDSPAQEAVHQTYLTGMDIIPGGMDLASADLALADVPGRESVLKGALAGLRKDYQFMILDCPPSLSLLTVNALVAADHYLVPVLADYLALEGLANLEAAVARIRKGIGRCADLLGVLVTMADHRLNVTDEIISMIRRHFGNKVFRAEIRTNSKLKEAPSFGKAIFHYAPSSTGAEGYQGLTREVMRRAACQ